MSDRRNGLYYESMDIRNYVLTRNIGEYKGYRQSMLLNGGLAIGMPYAVETELVPYSLEDRSIRGLEVMVSNGRVDVAGNPENPRVTLGFLATRTKFLCLTMIGFQEI